MENEIVKKLVSKSVTGMIKRLIIYMLVFALIAVVPTVLISFFVSRNIARENGFAVALSVSISVADYLEDEDAPAFLTIPDAEKTAEYKKIESYIMSVKKNFGLHYLYVYTFDKDAKEITYIFNPVEKYDEASTIKLGSKTELSSFYDAELAAMDGYVLREPTYDKNKFGAVVIGISPVKNSEGDVVALVAGEYLLNEVLSGVATRTILTSVYCLVAIIAFIALVAVYVYFKLVRPLTSMSGDITHLIGSHTHRERLKLSADKTLEQANQNDGEVQSDLESHADFEAKTAKQLKKEMRQKRFRQLFKITKDAALTIAEDVVHADEESQKTEENL